MIEIVKYSIFMNFSHMLNFLLQNKQQLVLGVATGAFSWIQRIHYNTWITLEMGDEAIKPYTVQPQSNEAWNPKTPKVWNIPNLIGLGFQCFGFW